MLTFKEYLTEIEIQRHKMPQVNSKDIPEMMDWLKNKGLKITKHSIDPKIMIPIQAINAKAVAKIAKNKPEAALGKPILISGDMHILDGHHRYGALLKLNRKATVLKIHLPVMKALSAIKQFPKTEFREKGKISGSHHYKNKV